MINDIQPNRFFLNIIQSPFIDSFAFTKIPVCFMFPPVVFFFSIDFPQIIPKRTKSSFSL